jgi:hypothetical protein
MGGGMFRADFIIGKIAPTQTFFYPPHFPSLFPEIEHTGFRTGCP